MAGDQICKDVHTYMEGETLNPSAKKHFTEFSHNLAAIQDYRNAQVIIWATWSDLECLFFHHKL